MRAEIDYRTPDFGTYYDELPLWSAPFGRLLLDVVPLRRGLEILEVGPGTGYLSIELAQRCGPESRVVAVDTWAVGLDRLRAKVGYLGLANVEAVEGDAATVELPSASLDLIVSSLGINNFADPAAVLANCLRVAKPGATLALATNLSGHMAEFYDPFRETLVELDLTEALPGLRSHEENRGTVESLSALLATAGFEVGRVVTDSFRMRFADGTTFLDHYLIRLGFLGNWRALVPPESVEEVFARLEERLNLVAARDGELALTIPMACLVATRPVD